MRDLFDRDSLRKNLWVIEKDARRYPAFLPVANPLNRTRLRKNSEKFGYFGWPTKPVDDF